jgi:exonuclease III
LQAVLLKKACFSVPDGLVRSGSTPAVVDSSEQPPAKKKQAKLSSFYAQPVAMAVKTELAVTAPAAAPASDLKDTVVKVSYDFEDEEKGHAGEGRTITVEFGTFILVACYVPNSGEGLRRLDYRIDEWYGGLVFISRIVYAADNLIHREPHMRNYLRKLSARKPVVFTGDLNCGHLDLDVHNPGAKHIVKQAGLTPQERKAFTQMLQECGFRDAFRHLYPGT